MEVRLVHPDAKCPVRSTPGSAGLDLFACEPGVLAPGAHALIPTGLELAIPPSWYGRIAPRSGLAVRYGINIHAGVIDSDYRKEVKIAAINHGQQPWEWKVGERIAQIILEWHWKGDPMVVDHLDCTERVGGFGSTGL